MEQNTTFWIGFAYREFSSPFGEQVILNYLVTVAVFVFCQLGLGATDCTWFNNTGKGIDCKPFKLFSDVDVSLLKKSI